MSLAPVVAKYLKRSETDYNLEPELAQRFQTIIVIPVYAEMNFLPATLESLAENNKKFLQQTLVLLVINNPPSEGDPAKFAENQEMLQLLRSSQFPCQKELNLVWIDASSENCEIRKKGGVGQARKIGMDLALRYLKSIETGILICLDADSLVEANYLEAIIQHFQNNFEHVAAVINYKHQPSDDPAQNEAIKQYEHFMRSYVQGLEFAKSPYAFHTIGSTIAVTGISYVRAGGMKAKNGGEDFYFLQALRKFGPVGTINDTTVYPSSRPSDRVPFGTGPKIQLIMDGQELGFYNPAVFQELKAIYELLNRTELNEFAIFADQMEASLSNETMAFFNQCDFRKNWERILDNTPKNAEKLKAAFNTLFDAFRTLKLIHFLEETYPAKFARLPYKKIKQANNS